MTTSATQLKIAAQWLREAATQLHVLQADKVLRGNLRRVADECEAAARTEMKEAA